ncbi:LysR substrate-binding domain-containing protein [Marinobacterium arenosum]|uniref:LysR substrate-binding domain-containing protein n=1 Tax=Marinobacterium arenosum TaxID=2862496 RepID=UPI001C96A755|nr:LysR substrate-binding domain-containing protein [Marinobacterium arenosum]MBY4675809.1 LysR family transcriptional regulator [Marinobacterium arenosum]
MRQLPPLNLLPAFEAVARHSSLQAAAEELTIPAAELESQLCALERFLGFSLLERKQGGLALNCSGLQYYRAVQQMLDRLAAVTASVRQQNPPRPLRLRAFEPFLERWLLPRILDFQGRHPAIDIDLGGSRLPHTWLEGDADIWISFDERPPAGLDYDRLYREVLIPVCAPTLRAQLGHAPAFRELFTTQLLYDQGRAEDWRLWWAAVGDGPWPEGESMLGFNRYGLLIESALLGLGVAIGHLSLVKSELDAGRLVELYDRYAMAPQRYYAVYAEGALERPAVRQFREWLHQQVCLNQPA